MTIDRTALLLNDETLSGLGISTMDVVDAIEAAMSAQAQGSVLTAPKSAVVPSGGRYMMTTLAVSDNPDLTIVKSVMVSPRNPDRGLDSIEGHISIQDSETGLLRAIMGAKWVTAVRTAGLSAVAARRMANPESQIVAFVGCGTQAHSHLNAFADLFPLTGIRVYGRGQANIDKLCAAAQAKGLDAQVCTDPQQALQDADIIVTSITLSYDTDPFLDASWMKPGAFAAITDLALPWRPHSLAGLDQVFIDSREQELSAPKPMVDPAIVTGELADLLSSPAGSQFDSGRRNAFVFRGLAIGDYALAALAYARAIEKAQGVEITL